MNNNHLIGVRGRSLRVRARTGAAAIQERDTRHIRPCTSVTTLVSPDEIGRQFGDGQSPRLLSPERTPAHGRQAWKIVLKPVSGWAFDRTGSRVLAPTLVMRGLALWNRQKRERSNRRNVNIQEWERQKWLTEKKRDEEEAKTQEGAGAGRCYRAEQRLKKSEKTGSFGRRCFVGHIRPTIVHRRDIGFNGIFFHFLGKIFTP